MRIGRVEAGVAALAPVLYVLTIAFTATTAAELLLAAFMCSLLLVFAIDLLDRAVRNPTPSSDDDSWVGSRGVLEE